MMASKTSPREDGAFWTWSNDVYRKTGASDRLIALQDAAGLDVNIALWCAWVGLETGLARPKDIRRAAAAADDWASDVVGPIRAARRALKSAPDEADGADALRKQVKKIELEAERIEQTLLERLAPQDPQGPAGPEAAVANLAAYCEIAEARVEEEQIRGLVDCLASDPGEE